MIVYTKKQLTRLLKVDFIRFCIVGGTGFVINAVLLVGLHNGFKLSIPVAQFISAEVALFSNFMLHNRWTYKHNYVEKNISTLLLQFHASSWPAIIGSTLMVSAGVKLFHLRELVALIVSSVIALGWNFGWSKYVIWRDVKAKQIEEIIR